VGVVRWIMCFCLIGWTVTKYLSVNGIIIIIGRSLKMWENCLLLAPSSHTQTCSPSVVTASVERGWVRLPFCFATWYSERSIPFRVHPACMRAVKWSSRSAGILETSKAVKSLPSCGNATIVSRLGGRRPAAKKSGRLDSRRARGVAGG